MRGTWKMAALVAGWAAMGLVGCAQDVESTAEETTPAVMAQDVDVAEEITEENMTPERRMSAAPTEDGTDEAVAAQFGRRRPPHCRHGSHLVRVFGGGFVCRGGGPFASLPFCPPHWQLVHQGRGWLCERGFGPPHRPLASEITEQ